MASIASNAAMTRGRVLQARAAETLGGPCPVILQTAYGMTSAFVAFRCAARIIAIRVCLLFFACGSYQHLTSSQHEQIQHLSHSRFGSEKDRVCETVKSWELMTAGLHRSHR
jgi:hypothetical protein